MTPFASEFLGTAVLVAIGTAVMCAARLPRTAGSATDGPGMGWLGIALGWGAALALG
jgi:glycerol uptake facilitator-like aquaporin